MSVGIEHYRKFPAAQKAALLATYAEIKKLLPGSVEVISYGMPAFKVAGESILGLEGFKNHNSIFPFSGSILATVAEAKAYKGTKSGLHFPADEQLPSKVIKAILRAKVAALLEAKPHLSDAFGPIQRACK